MEHEQFPEVDHFVLNEGRGDLAAVPAGPDTGQARRVYCLRRIPRYPPDPCAALATGKSQQYDTISIQFSRGCPFNCDFCNVTSLLGHRPRTKTAAQIIAELDSSTR